MTAVGYEEEGQNWSDCNKCDCTDFQQIGKKEVTMSDGTIIKVKSNLCQCKHVEDDHNEKGLCRFCQEKHKTDEEFFAAHPERKPVPFRSNVVLNESEYELRNRMVEWKKLK